jgi:hypothetical protein
MPFFTSSAESTTVNSILFSSFLLLLVSKVYIVPLESEKRPTAFFRHTPTPLPRWGNQQRTQTVEHAALIAVFAV